MESIKSLKQKQWLAFLLLAFTDIRIILSVICMQVPFLADKFPYMVSGLGMSAFIFVGAVFALIANIILSRISPNIATSRMMLYSGIFFFIGALGRVMFTLITSFTQPMEIMFLFSIYMSALYFVTAVIRMYTFGVISRSNSKCTLVNKVQWVWFAIMAMDWVMDYKLLGMELLKQWFPIYTIVSCILFITVQYIFIFQTVFDGKKDNSPAPKGTYSPFSKYMLAWFVFWGIYMLAIFVKPLFDKI